MINIKLINIPYVVLYRSVTIDTTINNKLPKSVLKRETKISGIKYNVDHNNNNIVKSPIIFVFIQLQYQYQYATKRMPIYSGERLPGV